LQAHKTPSLAGTVSNDFVHDNPRKAIAFAMLRGVIVGMLAFADETNVWAA
jgi:ElaB/YqjD/DUF883 family membrane-anchored ribosome-binding protein